MEATKEKSSPMPGSLTALRALLCLVFAFLLAGTRAEAFFATPDQAPGILAPATPDSTGKTTTAWQYDALDSLIAARVIPNPGGKLGDAVTRQTTQNVIRDAQTRGFTDIQTEVLFRQGPLGTKNRFVDVIGTNPQTGDSLLINIGKQTKSGVPIMRERQALDDIIFSPTIQQYPNSQLLFIEKGASGL